MKMEKFDTVDDYINSFEGEKKALLVEFRKKIKALTPLSVESMSYGLPGYKLNGKPLVYFAAFKSRIGFFPTPNGMDALDEEAKPYRTGKGTLQFKFDQPIPFSLITKIVRYRVKQCTEKKQDVSKY